MTSSDDSAPPAEPDQAKHDAVSRLAQERGLVGRTVGERPRPRTILWFGPGSSIPAELASAQLFPTDSVFERLDPATINLDEWDLLITDQQFNVSRGEWGYIDSARIPPRIFVVAFGATYNLGKAASSIDPQGVEITYGSSTVPAREFIVPEWLPDDLERLVERDLLPQAKLRESHPVLDIRDARGIKALLTTSTHNAVLAAFFARHGGSAEVLALPADVTLHTEWIKAAMRRWRSIAPGVFAHLPDWESSAQWASPEERSIMAALAELETEQREAQAEFEKRRADLEGRLHAARVAADAGVRRLLIGASGALVAAVADALRGFGFQVEDRDAVADPGRNLEDLRVTDPNDPEWVALVEVRSYTGGASPRDLSKLSKWQSEYAAAEGRFPDALWYVVNQMVGRDPEARPRVLEPEQATLDTWAEDHNLMAIDTADLFQLSVAVAEGQLDLTGARALLRAAGRVTWPPSDDDS